MKKKQIVLLISALWMASACPADEKPQTEIATAELVGQDALSSSQMEKDLQQLKWKQFRSVIEAVPKMKADVDAYGPLGWQYVQANYTTYGWKKNIDRLDDEQKRQLAELIQRARQHGP